MCCIVTVRPDLQACINAHVLEKSSLCDGSEADYCVSSHLPQITKVNVCGQVCAARSLQHIMQFVSSKALQRKKKRNFWHSSENDIWCWYIVGAFVCRSYQVKCMYLVLCWQRTEMRLSMSCTYRFL